MFKSTVDKTIAKAISKSKLIFLIPSVFAGAFAGLFYATREISLTPTLLYGVVLPITLALGFGAAFWGLSIGAKAMIGDFYQLTDSELIVKSRGMIKNIKVAQIKSVKESSFGLKIKDGNNSVFIPKQIDQYAEFLKKFKA